MLETVFDDFQKEQASVSVSNLSDDPSLILKRWRGPKARSNRYQPWEKESQAGIQSKQEDKWEFPRHRLKVMIAAFVDSRNQ